MYFPLVKVCGRTGLLPGDGCLTGEPFKAALGEEVGRREGVSVLEYCIDECLSEIEQSFRVSVESAGLTTQSAVAPSSQET